MIETAIIFVLGVLTATLIALLVGPYLWRRAARLARDHVLATAPLRLSELAAQMDLVRAEYAVRQRRTEVRLEEARAALAQRQIELGRKEARLNELGIERTGLKTLHAELQARIEDLKGSIIGLEKQVNEQSIALREKQHTISATNEALLARMTELSQANALADSRKVELVALRTQREAMDGDKKELEAKLEATQKLLQEHQDRVAELRTEVSTKSLKLERFDGEGKSTLRRAQLRRRVSRLRRERALALRRELEDAKAKIAEQKIALSSVTVRNVGDAARQAASTEQTAKLTARVSELESRLTERQAKLDELESAASRTSKDGAAKRDEAADEAPRETTCAS